MGKKLTGTVFVVVMFLSLFSLVACNSFNLADYQTSGKTAIRTYADIKVQENDYTNAGLQAIEVAVTDGIDAVDTADSKVNVDMEIDAAKTEINAIERDACEAKTQAKQTYLNTILKPKHPEATIADISFTPFLGIYDSSLVAIFYGGQYHGMFPEVEDSYELEGLVFAFSRGYPILVWNDEKISDLPAAYAQGLLTKENLMMIHNLYYQVSDGMEDKMKTHLPSEALIQLSRIFLCLKR